MDRDCAIKLVQDAIRDHADVWPSKYTLDTTFKELDIDSLDIVNVSLIIEDVIGERIEDIDLNHFKTVGSLVSLLEQKYHYNVPKPNAPSNYA